MGSNQGFKIMREVINILMAGLLFGAGAAMAAPAKAASDSRTFGAFERLDVARGIEIHVACGPQAKAELSGSSADLADVTTEVRDGTLRIRRGTLFNNNSHNDSVVVHLTAPRPLVGISASTGVEAEIDACAVSPDHLDISATTGVDLALAGSTQRASIEASTGARIQPLDGKRFDAREVKVSASTGADIRLCSVEHIEGKASLGSSITADSKGGSVQTSMGAAFSVESCR
jgi:hypothetical protein